MKRSTQRLSIAGTLIAGLVAGGLPLAGCESLPGNEKQQGAVIGGAGGAAAGAAIAKENRLLGALIGGAIGAGGGYLIGAQVEKVRDEKRDEAIASAERAQHTPVSAEDVADASTADINDDGFVTLDEVVAMEKAGLSNDEILDRLRDTGMIFELTTEQEDRLVAQGVSRQVVREMRTININERDQLVREQQRDADEVLGREER